MYKKTVSGIMLILLLTSILSSAFNVQSAKAEPKTIIVPDDYPTIQEAINAANQGDTVYVRAGTYCESIVVDKTLSLMGENRSTTVIDGNMSDYVVKILAENVRISGFTIKNAHFVHVRIYSDNNILRNNRIVGAGAEISYWGVYLGLCDNNTVEGNIIKGCGEGIMVESSSYNKIIENTIMSNHRGIRLTTAAHIPEGPPSPPSYYNIIYHNNFVNNSLQASDYGITTIWDDGYPSGGNYWSDYNGTDLYSGVYQNETGSDGIGDAPYIIDENSIDNYPLMNPWTPTPPVPEVLTATVDIHPEALNLGSRGKWITAYIELPEGYDITNINVSTIMLNDTVPAELRPVTIGDYDDDGIPDLMVKFERAEVISYIIANINVTKLFEERLMTISLTITGYLNDGIQFKGDDAVRIRMPTPRGLGYIIPI